MEKFKLKESILSDRIILLRSTHEHDDDIWQSIEESRHNLREYLFWVDKTQRLKDVIKTTDMFDEKWENDEEWRYSIYSIPHKEYVGCIGVHCIDFLSLNAELGYWLRLSAQGQGYMTEAVQVITKELFAQGMHRVVIKCDMNNYSSANVAKRCGYELESIAKEALFHYTGLHDVATYVKFNEK